MKFFLVVFTFLLIHFNSNAQNTFQKVIKNSGFSASIIETDDGSFVLSGQTGNSFDLKNLLIKINNQGDTIWTRIFKVDSLVGIAPYLAKTFDNGFILTSINYNAFMDVIRTDSNGSLLWAKRISSGYDLYSIIQLSDSGTMIMGSTYSDQTFLMKLNLNGDTVWTRAYAGSSSLRGLSIFETIDNGFIISGISSNAFCFLLKIDAVGNIIWSRAFVNNNGLAFSQAVRQTFDGGFIIVGSHGILKVNSLGNLEWQMQYQNACGLMMESIIQTLDSGLVVTGTATDSSCLTESIFMLKTDRMGNYQWCKAFTKGEWDPGPFERNPVLQTSDSGFITTGLRHLPFDTSGIYIIKTDQNGNSNCDQHDLPVYLLPPDLQQNNVTTNLYPTSFTIDTISFISGHLDSIVTICNSLTYSEGISKPYNDFSISPNPAEDHFSICNSVNSINEIQLYNLWGQLIFSIRVDSLSNTSTINCEQFSKGIYFVKVSSDQGSTVKKIIIQ